MLNPGILHQDPNSIVTIHRTPERWRIECKGIIDAADMIDIREALAPLGPDDLPVQLDLSAVTHFSALAKEILFAFTRRSEASGVIVDVRLPEMTSDPKPSPRYCERVAVLREMFPAPESNRLHDSYFTFCVSEGLRHLDRMKTHRPYLGERKPLDFAAARQHTLPEESSTVEHIIEQLATYLDGMDIWGHPRTQFNVVPPTTIPAVVGHMFGGITNVNVVSERYSQRAALAEVEATAICAELVGYDRELASGIFTFGGTGTVLYGVKVGLQKAIPDCFEKGLRRDVRIIGSNAAHYANVCAAAWLGIGMNNLIQVPTTDDNAMDLSIFERTLDETLRAGIPVAAIVVTMGTTDAFGMDNLVEIARIRDAMVERYRLDYVPHIHADAVIGWAWRVFDDYDFATNPLSFMDRPLASLRQIRDRLRGLPLADSIGFDFHKTGFAPYLSSLFLCQTRADLSRIARDPASMPYLFNDSKYSPGIFTLETSRSGGAVLAALANLRLFGKNGFRSILGYLVTMANRLAEFLMSVSYACVVNRDNWGPVNLFRLYPPGIDAKQQYILELNSPAHAADLVKHNAYNVAIAQQLNEQVDNEIGVALSLTERYRTTKDGTPVFALKSYMITPFIVEATVEHLIACIDRARTQVNQRPEWCTTT